MIVFSVDPARQIRTAAYSGVVTDDDLREAYGRLLAEPDYDPSLDDLADLSAVERLEISAAALRQLIQMFTPVDQLGVPTRLAIVAPTDATFGVGRMYELLRGDGVPEEIRVFRTYDAAVDWLTDPRRTR